MALSFVSMMNAPRLAVAEMQRQLMDRQTEAATGRKVDVGLDLGSRTHQAVSLRYDFDLNNTQKDVNGVTSAQLELTQNVLTSMNNLAHDFTSTVVGARNAVNGQQVVKQAAEQALAGLTALLNTDHDGQFIFAGVNSSNSPVAKYQSSPPSAAKQALDAAFLAQFGFSQNSPLAASITGTQMDSFIDGVLSGQFSPANWSANWSSASDQNRVARVDQNQTLAIPVNANMQPMRDLVMALTAALDLGTGNLSQGTFQALVDKSAALAGKASGGFGDVQALVGNVQQEVSSATERITSKNNILNREINALESVDPYEAATRVNTLTSQLEASYSLTARLSRLSLLNYIS